MSTTIQTETARCVVPSSEADRAKRERTTRSEAAARFAMMGEVVGAMRLHLSSHSRDAREHLGEMADAIASHDLHVCVWEADVIPREDGMTLTPDEAAQVIRMMEA